DDEGLEETDKRALTLSVDVASGDCDDNIERETLELSDRVGVLVLLERPDGDDETQSVPAGDEKELKGEGLPEVRPVVVTSGVDASLG
ncbi:hypothetical protein ABK046_47815, partial [Streptomyces caeruleatus]